MAPSRHAVRGRAAALRRAAETPRRYSVHVLTCVHAVQWVRRVAGGLHQCILCQQVVGRKDVYPRFEDLTPEFRARWEAHERSAQDAEPTAPEAGPAGPRAT